jgi:hypothetical protein
MHEIRRYLMVVVGGVLEMVLRMIMVEVVWELNRIELCCGWLMRCYECGMNMR